MKYKPSKVLVLGSGGLTIGQAGEFDYSGTQAVHSLLELGCEVIVINPNIATVQTNPQPNVKVYLYPVEPEWVEKVIAEEKPDSIVAGFGGQTALNCVCKLEDLGILKKYSVKNLGTSIVTLKMTEDRDLFAKKMSEIGIPIPPSCAAETTEAALKAAEKIGFPVIIRAAFALGGLGSGVAYNAQELEKKTNNALALSSQVLVEKYLKGWKEVEYEVMRDAFGNVITICNMENFDPLGIHTGDSIVVCPSQTLTDQEYQLLRNAAINIVQACEIVGECNVQFALNPFNHEFFVIEINARLSRSSALASKASGYPIAFIAAKVVCGANLLELKNPVTGVTSAFFEPALDYITVKIPRWDLNKFHGTSRQLDSTMKSVGEVMGIGRSFPEALQKAVRMVSENSLGLSHDFFDVAEEQKLQPTDTRLFQVIQALRKDVSIEKIYEETAIDQWFLYQCQKIVRAEKEIKKGNLENLRQLKQLGFSDDQMAFLQAGKRDDAGSRKIRELRKKQKIVPAIKRIDTTAAEYPSITNYFYMTYHGEECETQCDKVDKKALILGCGAYRIGVSVEFDWCVVNCVTEMRKNSWQTIVINCNPETISTDFKTSDKLYFEELTVERIMDIHDFEKPTGIICSMGGQLPNLLAQRLSSEEVRFLGHSPQTIQMAEDREKFSNLLDSLSIDQPRWIIATDWNEVQKFVKEIGFPILVRPSYVLSGAAMRVTYDEQSLQTAVLKAAKISDEFPVVLSEFISGAQEIEFDGIAQNGNIVTSVVSEHIEHAGVHSGDATVVVPAQKLYIETVRRVNSAARELANALQLNGPFNIQFLARSNNIKVIECNARASRSFPFVSKVTSVDFAKVSAHVFMGEKLKPIDAHADELPHVGVKAPLFSFTRLAGFDPILGVEMLSTGEVGCIGPNYESAMYLSCVSSKIFPPQKAILVSAGTEAEKIKFLDTAKLIEKNKIPIYATRGTADFLKQHKIDCQIAGWPGEENDAIKLIQAKKIDFVINIPKNNLRQEVTNGMLIRQAATRHGCSLLTNTEKTIGFFRAWENYLNQNKTLKLLHLPPFQAK